MAKIKIRKSQLAVVIKKENVMKLLLLLPISALLAISGYNLSTGSNNLAVMLLHFFVMALCIVFAALIIKSMFAIKYVEMPETEDKQAYEELNLQHS